MVNSVNEYAPVFETNGTSLTIIENATVGDVIYQVRFNLLQVYGKYSSKI